FQAEDGIRDKLVTGVQTCALPISVRLMSSCGIDMSRMREMRIVNAGRIAVNAPRSSAFLRKPNAIRVQAGSNDALGKCFKLLAIGLEFFLDRKSTRLNSSH